MTISKILIIGLVCLLIGGILPYLFLNLSGKLIILFGALLVILGLLLIKKGKITIYDWLILFFLSIPFHDYRIMFGSFFLRLTEVCFIPLLVWGVIQMTRQEADRRNLFKLNAEYIILLFFSAFTAMSVLLSADPFVGTYRTIILAYLVILSFIISKVLKEEDKIYLIVKALIAVSAGASIFAILQAFLPAFQPFYPIPLIQLGSVTLYRSGVGWQNPNYFALYLSMILPITYVCKIYKLFPEKKFIQTCFVLQTCGIFCTYSRLGFISLGLTFLFLLWVRGKKTLVLIMVIVIAVLSVLTFTSMAYIYEHNPYLAVTIFRIPNPGLVLKNPLLIAGWRRDAWVANARMFLDHPFIGIGPFMSTAMYEQYRPTDQVYPWKSGLAVHSEYLSLLSERGIIGTALFFLFLLFLMTRANLYYQQNKSAVSGKLMLGLWASIVNFIWFSFGGATIYSVEFWINVGLILAVYNLGKAKRIEENQLNQLDK